MNTATVSFTIDGKTVTAAPGASVLAAALAADIYIPSLCWHEDLEPYGGCRMCLVEIEGMRGLPTACTTTVSEGMKVTTRSAALDEVRINTLELILSQHPCECLVCHRRERCGPDDVCLRQVEVTDRCVTCPSNQVCELQQVVDYIGVRNINVDNRPRLPRDVDTSNPFFDLDRNRCILCARCVRTCTEVTGIQAIAITNRGFEAKVGTFTDAPLIESICKSCGECMARCPVGALTPKETTRPEREVKTTCTYCGVGCSMYLGVKDDRIIGVRGDREGPANHGRLCVKGRFGIAEFVNHEDRLKQPLIRKDGVLVEVSWDEALDYVASHLKKYSSEEVAVISSAKATNEDNYVMQKLARGVMGTNNIDHCARL